MQMLRRELAPINSEAWRLIDDQITKSLRSKLSVRRFADVKGPFGWAHAAEGQGHLGKLTDQGGLSYGVHKVRPLVEMRLPFSLDIWALDDALRGARDVDLSAVEEAADRAADFEEKALYHGLKDAAIEGLAAQCAHPEVKLQAGHGGNIQASVASALRMMQTDSAVCGPYTLVAGKPLQEEMDKMLGNHTLHHALLKLDGLDEIIYSPYYDGAFLVSTRGGDFELTLGQDFSVGFQCADEGKVNLYIAESFTFAIYEPRAYVPLALV